MYQVALAISSIYILNETTDLIEIIWRIGAARQKNPVLLFCVAVPYKSNRIFNPHALHGGVS